MFFTLQIYTNLSKEENFPPKDFAECVFLPNFAHRIKDIAYMNSIKTSLLACSLLLSLACCVSSPEMHQLSPIEQSIILYADQTVDSVCFYTFDSWTVTPQDEWITINGDSHKDIVNDYTKRYYCKVFLTVQPNTTGQTRCGTVLVKSYEYSYSAPFVQLGLLKVSHPAYTVDSYLDDSYVIPKLAHYELIDSAHCLRDSICFTVQNNWTLNFDGEQPEWLDLDSKSGASGKCRVNLTLTPNSDTENGREAKLKLTSGAVSNEIVVRQLPAKKEED